MTEPLTPEQQRDQILDNIEDCERKFQQDLDDLDHQRKRLEEKFQRKMKDFYDQLTKLSGLS